MTADEFGYGYDRGGNRLFKENTVAPSAHDELYAYDSLRRLIDARRGDLNVSKDGISTLAFSQSWSLDLLGNWAVLGQDDDGNGTADLHQARSHNQANEIIAITAASGLDWVDPQHDAAGNITLMPKPENPAQSFTASYDAWNRLVKLSDGAATVAEYQYDGRGRRVVKTAGGETRHFYYSNDWQVLEERIGTSANPNRQYVWGLIYVDELICRHRDANGGLAGDGTLEEIYYVAQDANFNVTALVADDGSIDERYCYTPYGQKAVLSGTFGTPAGDLDLLYGHQGLRHDNESKLVENRNRVLHPSLGRFLRRDPAGTVDGINLYQYLRNGPVNFVDPSGLYAKSIDCDKRQIAMIQRAESAARSTANEGYNYIKGDLSGDGGPGPWRPVGAWQRVYPSIRGDKVEETEQFILRLAVKLNALVRAFKSNDYNVECECSCKENRDAYVYSPAKRLLTFGAADGNIHFCPPFFDDLDDRGRAATFLHEFAHKYGPIGDVHSHSRHRDAPHDALWYELLVHQGPFKAMDDVISSIAKGIKPYKP